MGENHLNVYSARPFSRAEPQLPQGYTFRLWRPTLRNVLPPTLGARFRLWTVAHYFRLFHNRDYAVLLIVNAEGEPVHRSCLVPSYFRWPFMGRNDLQISSTWTTPNERRKGLATAALVKAMAIMDCPDRKFWYITRESNMASIAACGRAGFSFVGLGQRVNWMGVRLLGHVRLDGQQHC